MEGSSGPGVLTFVSDTAAAILSKRVPGSILRLQSNLLVCISQAEIAALRKHFAIMANHATPPAQRHLIASVVKDLRQSRRLEDASRPGRLVLVEG
jgi:hypothetical protein